MGKLALFYFWCGTMIMTLLHCEASFHLALFSFQLSFLNWYIENIDARFLFTTIWNMQNTDGTHTCFLLQPDGFPMILFYPAGKKSFEPVSAYIYTMFHFLYCATHQYVTMSCLSVGSCHIMLASLLNRASQHSYCLSVARAVSVI